MQLGAAIIGSKKARYKQMINITGGTFLISSIAIMITLLIYGLCYITGENGVFIFACIVAMIIQYYSLFVMGKAFEIVTETGKDKYIKGLIIGIAIFILIIFALLLLLSSGNINVTLGN